MKQRGWKRPLFAVLLGVVVGIVAMLILSHVFGPKGAVIGMMAIGIVVLLMAVAVAFKEAKSKKNTKAASRVS